MVNLMARGENKSTSASAQSRRARQIAQARYRIYLFNTVIDDSWEEALRLAGEEDGPELLEDLVWEVLENEYSEAEPYRPEESWSVYQNERTKTIDKRLSGIDFDELAWQLRFEGSGQREPQPVSWQDMAYIENYKPPSPSQKRSGRELLLGRKPSSVARGRDITSNQEAKRLHDEFNRAWEESDLPDKVKKDFRSHGATPEIAKRWHTYFNFDGELWRKWASKPLALDNFGRYVYFSPTEAMRWIEVGADFDDARSCIEKGIDPYQFLEEKAKANKA